MKWNENAFQEMLRYKNTFQDEWNARFEASDLSRTPTPKGAVPADTPTKDISAFPGDRKCAPEEWYYAFRTLWDLSDAVFKRQPFKIAPAEALAYRELRSQLVRALEGYPLCEKINRLLPADIDEMSEECGALIYSTRIFPALALLETCGDEIPQPYRKSFCEKRGKYCHVAFLQDYKVMVAGLWREAKEFCDMASYERSNGVRVGKRCIIHTSFGLFKGADMSDCVRDYRQAIAEAEEEIRELETKPWMKCDESECLPFWEEAGRNQEAECLRSVRVSILEGGDVCHSVVNFEADRHAISAISALVRTWREAAGMPKTVDRSEKEYLPFCPGEMPLTPEEAMQQVNNRRRGPNQRTEYLINAIKEIAGEENAKGMSYEEIARQVRRRGVYLDCEWRQIRHAVDCMRRRGENWPTKNECL